MGINDKIRDGYNWVFGGMTNHGQEGFILRGRLVDLSDKPYGAAALAKIDALAADGFDMNTEGKEVFKTFMDGLTDHLKKLPVDQRFGEFKYAVSKFGGGQIEDMMSAFDNAPSNVQQALMNAVTANPRFVDHVVNNDTGPLANLLTKENLNTYGNQIADILNSVASDPNYPLEKLDKLGVDAKAFFEEQAKGDKANKEKLAELQKNLLNSVRDAGGNIPAFANINGEMLMRFLHNLMTGDLEGAINEFGNDLGLKGDQLANFQELARPLAGMVKFMGQDYYEYGMHYGPRAFAGGQQYFQTATDLWHGNRVEYKPQVAAADNTVGDGAALDTGDKPVQLASADYSDVSFTAPANVSGQGLDGVTKMTAGTANDYLAGKGITSTVTPDQERAVAAYDAQTETIRRMSNQNAFAMA